MVADLVRLYFGDTLWIPGIVFVEPFFEINSVNPALWQLEEVLLPLVSVAQVPREKLLFAGGKQVRARANKFLLPCEIRNKNPRSCLAPSSAH